MNVIRELRDVFDWMEESRGNLKIVCDVRQARTTYSIVSLEHVSAVLKSA